MVAAKSEKENERWETIHHLLAWHAANIMTVTSGKKITSDKLLGKKKTKKPRGKNLATEHDREQYEAMKEELLNHLNSKNRG